jgi:ankyrin repeat protein
MLCPAQLRWELSRAIYHDDASQLPIFLENCLSCDRLDIAHETNQKINDASGEHVEIDAMFCQQLIASFVTFNSDPIVYCVMVVGAAFNRVQVVQRSLALMDEDVTLFSAIEKHYDCAVEAAMRKGHANVIELLLPRFDPGARRNRTIRWSSHDGHASIVELLLADPRVDPRADDDHALLVSSENGHAGVIKLLLADPRIDPAVKDNLAIRLASRNGHASVVKLLLADPRVDPSADAHYAIRWSSVNGHASVVKLLLADPRVDPSADDNCAIRRSSRNGHASVVELLLAHDKTSATRNALIAADVRDCWDIVRLLVDGQPQVMLQLFESATVCKSGGVLRDELRRWERRSAAVLLLAVERRLGKLTMSDVLRYAIQEYACFDVVDSADQGIEWGLLNSNGV